MLPWAHLSPNPKRHFDRFSRFWATVCKTVRHQIVGCLSVTLVYGGQTVGRMKMKLGTHVGLGPGHIVLDGDPALPPQRGVEPPPYCRPISVAAKWLDGSRCHLAWR